MGQFFNMHPKTHVNMADVGGFPHMMKATVVVRCPKCANEANIGGTTDGNTAINCDCGHSEVIKGTDSNAIVKAFFLQLGNSPA